MTFPSVSMRSRRGHHGSDGLRAVPRVSGHPWDAVRAGVNTYREEPVAVQVLTCFTWSGGHHREVDVNFDRLVEVVREHVERHVADRLGYLLVGDTRSAGRCKVLVRH